MSRESGGVLVETPLDVGLGGGAGGALGVRTGRRTSKSVSGARPPLSTSASSHRVLGTYTNPYSTSGAGLSSAGDIDAGPSSAGTGPSGSPSLGPQRVRNGLKRRISTPNLMKRSLVPEDDEEGEAAAASSSSQGGLQAGGTPSSTAGGNRPKLFETRARSTSTSIVVPQTLLQPEPESTITTDPGLPPPPVELPTPPWSGMYVTPPSPPPTIRDRGAEHAPSLLGSAYNLGESVLSKVLSWTQPAGGHARRSRRRSHASDDDSEKGLNGSEADLDEKYYDDDQAAHDGNSAGGWGLFGGNAARTVPPESPSYFALPPTPPDDHPHYDYYPGSLPTPAISTQSLSHPTRRQRRASRAAALKDAQADGWWVKVYRTVSVSHGGKTAQVLRELGWTVSMLVGLFVVSFLLVLYAASSMPITQLKSMPKSTTDLQLLSAEMRSYMASGTAGWWHTVGVLTYIGCWKHAWSVPGAVVLNILVGSVFEPVAALLLLTLITAFGSLGAYMLSRPLAPLIAVLFPRPLALVRAALAPESVPKPVVARNVPGERITPVCVSDDPAEVPLGAVEDRPNVWRRLLLMRAMGFVPWSGMNVACGVVGVDWRTFWLTTAAGSASWSYVTASVGNILSRLAVPTQDGAEVQGESLTSLLRDPTLIAKLVFLTLLTLVPVLLKRRGVAAADEPDSEEEDDDASLSDIVTPTSPQVGSALGLDTGLGPLSINNAEYPAEVASPLAVSLASFTPTPHVFDLLSFGRTAMRQGVKVVVGSARRAVTSAQRILGA